MWTYFLLTVAIFACLNGILVLGFNLQFGYAGIMNLAYIVLVAVGAYGTAVATIGPAPHTLATTTHYLGGFGWRFPWNLMFGVACAVVFAVVLGSAAFRRLRHDYLAVTLVSIGAGLLVLITNDANLLNGATGLSGVMGPWSDQVSPENYQFVFLGVAVAALAVTYLIFTRVTRTPLGRLWKAIREDEDAAASLGKNTWSRKMVAFLLGAAAAGLGGGLFVLYAGGWNTQSWQPTETVALLAAAMVGGRGRNVGAFIGSVIVLEVIGTGTTFLPGIGNSVILPNLQSCAVGVLLLVFLWFRPQGLLPEQKESFAAAPSSTPGDSTAGIRDSSAVLESRATATKVRSGNNPIAPATNALELRDIRCSFGGVQAVDGLSLTIPLGGFVGIIGPNGAGKTTLIDCISGFNRSYKGRVFLFGAEITRLPPHRVAAMSLVRTFQAPRLFRRMTVLSNLMVAPAGQKGETLSAAANGAWRSQEASNLRQARGMVARFGLHEVTDNYAADLSGGQERIAELSRALMAAPKALLLDEPFAGVSPINRERLAVHLSELQRAYGMTIVMIEHRLEWVERLCQLVYVMANGRVLAQGSMDEMRSNRSVLDAYLGGTRESVHIGSVGT